MRTLLQLKSLWMWNNREKKRVKTYNAVSAAKITCGNPTIDCNSHIFVKRHQTIERMNFHQQSSAFSLNNTIGFSKSWYNNSFAIIRVISFFFFFVETWTLFYYIVFFFSLFIRIRGKSETFEKYDRKLRTINVHICVTKLTNYFPVTIFTHFPDVFV